MASSHSVFSGHRCAPAAFRSAAVRVLSYPILLRMQSHPQIPGNGAMAGLYSRSQRSTTDRKMRKTVPHCRKYPQRQGERLLLKRLVAQLSHQRQKVRSTWVSGASPVSPLASSTQFGRLSCLAADNTAHFKISSPSTTSVMFSTAAAANWRKQ